MKAKRVARLCGVSFVAGAVLTPPLVRMTKRQAGTVAHNGARRYVMLREKVKGMPLVKGRAGRYAMISAGVAALAAKQAADRWQQMVYEAEREMGVEEPDTFGHFVPPAPLTKVEEYIGSPS